MDRKREDTNEKRGRHYVHTEQREKRRKIVVVCIVGLGIARLVAEGSSTMGVKNEPRTEMQIV